MNTKMNKKRTKNHNLITFRKLESHNHIYHVMRNKYRLLEMTNQSKINRKTNARKKTTYLLKNLGDWFGNSTILLFRATTYYIQSHHSHNNILPLVGEKQQS